MYGLMKHLKLLSNKVLVTTYELFIKIKVLHFKTLNLRYIIQIFEQEDSEILYKSTLRFKIAMIKYRLRCHIRGVILSDRDE